MQSTCNSIALLLLLMEIVSLASALKAQTQYPTPYYVELCIIHKYDCVQESDCVIACAHNSCMMWLQVYVAYHIHICLLYSYV